MLFILFHYYILKEYDKKHELPSNLNMFAVLQRVLDKIYVFTQRKDQYLEKRCTLAT